MDSQAGLSPAELAIEAGGTSLSITWVDGRVSRFPALWLADNRPDTRRGAEGQRLSDAIELPGQIAVRGADIVAGGIEVAFTCFEHSSLFDPVWLRRHALDPDSRAERRRVLQLWDASLASHPLPGAEHDAIRHDKAALLTWLREVDRLGFALLHGEIGRAHV